jgi:predicted glycoside hydrolase/deacetylase ChbG (UPF0249 family)
MRRQSIILVCLVTLCLMAAVSSSPVFSQKKSAAERLGFPADSKLLIIHADDLGLAHGVDRSSFAALEQKAVTTASIMVPCPWLTEVAAFAKDHPDADLGLHLTVTSEWKSYRWGPLASRKDVRGLLDPAGYFWKDSPLVVKNAKPEEVELELRAQIEIALKAGIRPTHLDSHMGTLFSPAFFPVYVKLAREYGLPYFALRTMTASPALLPHIKETDVFPDALFMAAENVKSEQWMEFYLGVIRSLKPGLTEIIVHLGNDDAELQAVAEDHPAFGSAWRQRDFNVMTSPEFKNAIRENHVILIGWKEIKKLQASGN